MVSVSQMRIPSHMIVNREATGGNQANSESTPVEAAAASSMSFSWEVMGVSCNLDMREVLLSNVVEYL